MRKTITRITIILLIKLVIPSMVEASNWEVITSSRDDTLTVAIDNDSIKRLPVQGKKIICWLKFLYKDDQEFNQIFYRESRFLYTIDCDRNTYGTMKQTFYDKNDKKVYETSYKDNPKMTPVAPDTIGESIFKFVCSKWLIW